MDTSSRRKTWIRVVAVLLALAMLLPIILMVTTSLTNS